MARRKKSTHFHVAPRYTPGSPSGVPEETALAVAAEEKTAHERYLTGVYGDEAKAEAEKRGLLGIAEERTETRKGWSVRDLITGDTFVRPFPEAFRAGRLR